MGMGSPDPDIASPRVQWSPLRPRNKTLKPRPGAVKLTSGGMSWVFHQGAGGRATNGPPPPPILSPSPHTRTAPAAVFHHAVGVSRSRSPEPSPRQKGARVDSARFASSTLPRSGSSTSLGPPAPALEKKPQAFAFRVSCWRGGSDAFLEAGQVDIREAQPDVTLGLSGLAGVGGAPHRAENQEQLHNSRYQEVAFGDSLSHLDGPTMQSISDLSAPGTIPWDHDSTHGSSGIPWDRSTGASTRTVAGVVHNAAGGLNGGSSAPPGTNSRRPPQVPVRQNQNPPGTVKGTERQSPSRGSDKSSSGGSGERERGAPFPLIKSERMIEPEFVKSYWIGPTTYAELHDRLEWLGYPKAPSASGGSSSSEDGDTSKADTSNVSTSATEQRVCDPSAAYTAAEAGAAAVYAADGSAEVGSLFREGGAVGSSVPPSRNKGPRAASGREEAPRSSGTSTSSSSPSAGGQAATPAHELPGWKEYLPEHWVKLSKEPVRRLEIIEDDLDCKALDCLFPRPTPSLFWSKNVSPVVGAPKRSRMSSSASAGVLGSGDHSRSPEASPDFFRQSSPGTAGRGGHPRSTQTARQPFSAWLSVTPATVGPLVRSIGIFLQRLIYLLDESPDPGIYGTHLQDSEWFFAKLGLTGKYQIFKFTCSPRRVIPLLSCL